MLRQITKAFDSVGDKICPPKNRDDYGEEDLKLMTGYANFYVMAWTFIQIGAFLLLLSIFLFSSNNEFMKTETCCTANAVITDEFGIPSETCSVQSCELYDWIWEDSDGWNWNDDLPRVPAPGTTSEVFDYTGSKYCCNLAKESDQCCDHIEWEESCGLVMWGSCLAAMCGMLMTQVFLAGLYSWSARRSSFGVLILTIFVQPFLRTALFIVNFYLFFAFLFIFLFFWLGMLWCDNPYAWAWWRFGLIYFTDFFGNMGYVIAAGMEWDGFMDMNAMVGHHVIVATLIDVSFAVIYVILNKMLTNPLGQKVFDLTFFDL